MKLSTIQTTIRMALVLMISATVVVACGPDKHKHRMPMKTGNQKGINSKTGLGNTPLTAEQQKKQAEELKNRTANVETVEKKIAEAKKFTPIDKNTMADGTYDLDKVIVYYKHMKGSEDVRIYREYGIENFKLKELPGTYKVAGFAASFTDTPRFVEVPLKFIVDRTQNQDWTAAGDAAFPQVVNLRSVAVLLAKETTHDLQDENENIDPNARVKASVGNMLVSAQYTNGAYTIQDENGKTVTMRLLNVSDSRLNISFDIDEAGPTPLKARTIVLSYAISKKAQTAAAAPAPSTQATTSEGQLAPESSAATNAGGAAMPAETVPGVDEDQTK